MFLLFSYAAALLVGFILGRANHPANSKLNVIEAEIKNIEASAFTTKARVIARLRQLL